jgi:hypothetical protein
VRRRLAVLLAALSTWLGSPAPAAAHRLDEYLQASRLSIAMDRVDLEIDLTPGAAIAATVVGWIDTDHDGQVSDREGDAYATAVLGAVTLSADGRRLALTLNDRQFPDFADMMAGVGIIRLRAVASMAPTAGRHVLAYSNTHRSGGSVYLANALVPADHRITIASQRRDPAQHTLTLEYDVAASGWTRALSAAAALAVVGLIVVVRRDRAGRARRGDPIASSSLR